MANTKTPPAKEKFKTMIGGQALIEGIMMRGPEKDAIVVRTSKGLETEVHPRKLHSPKSVKSWPSSGAFSASLILRWWASRR